MARYVGGVRCDEDLGGHQEKDLAPCGDPTGFVIHQMSAHEDMAPRLKNFIINPPQRRSFSSLSGFVWTLLALKFKVSLKRKC